MSQKYKLLYYLKRVYVGGFSKTADWIIENAHSLYSLYFIRYFFFICSKCTLNLYFSSLQYSNQHGHGQIWMLYAIYAYY